MRKSIVKKILCAFLTISLTMALLGCLGAQEEKISSNKDEDVEVEEMPEVEVEAEEAPDLSKYIANAEALQIQTGAADNSNLEMIPIRYSYASSQLDAEKSYDMYSTENISDGDLTTAYVEGVEGDGIGQLLKFDFEGMCSYEIDRIRIYPGYQKDDETFKKNSRPLKLAFYFPDGHRFVQEFDYGNETLGYFDIDLNKVFAGHVVAHECVISIEDAISGDKYNDCCISEIEFYSSKDPDADVVLIGYETEYNDNGETCTVTASKDGQKIWEYEAKTDTVTELDGVGYIATANGIVFIQDDWQVLALDENTGNVIWKSNEANGFSVSANAYDPVTGKIYLSGYYGPTLIGFDKEGNKLECNADTDSYWPCVIVPDIDEASQVKKIDSVSIFFEGDSVIEKFNL